LLLRIVTGQSSSSDGRVEFLRQLRGIVGGIEQAKEKVRKIDTCAFANLDEKINSYSNPFSSVFRLRKNGMKIVKPVMVCQMTSPAYKS
jgi:hypothetical protein